jgi:hypothetical protein
MGVWKRFHDLLSRLENRKGKRFARMSRGLRAGCTHVRGGEGAIELTKQAKVAKRR